MYEKPLRSRRQNFHRPSGTKPRIPHLNPRSAPLASAMLETVSGLFGFGRRRHFQHCCGGEGVVASRIRESWLCFCVADCTERHKNRSGVGPRRKRRQGTEDRAHQQLSRVRLVS